MIGVALDEGRIKLDFFEGPLDLLLYLIRKSEIDIHDIPIVDITQQYQAMLDQARRQGLLDLDFAGDYFLMAATLIQIKARMLLPRPEAGEDGLPAEDPRRELVQQLLEYERFREAATMLQERSVIAQGMLPRPPEAVAALYGGEATLDVDLLALARAFRKVLEDKRLRTPHVYAPSRFTVRDRIRHVLAALEAGGGRTTFVSLFEEGTVEEAVVTFLAILELCKRGFLRARQEAPDADIALELVPEGERPDVADIGESEFDVRPAPPADGDDEGPSADPSEVADIVDEGLLEEEPAVPDDEDDPGADRRTEEDE